MWKRIFWASALGLWATAVLFAPPPAISVSGDRQTDDGVYAEIKRVFVLPQYRGRGLSRQIMGWIETELGRRGIKLCRLETGTRQPEALGLYAALGYVEREPFGNYRPDPLSVFMEKSLGAAE